MTFYYVCAGVAFASVPVSVGFAWALDRRDNKRRGY